MMRSPTALVLSVSFLLTACTAIPLTDDHAPVPALGDMNPTQSSALSVSTISDACPAVNTDAPDTTVTYSNTAKGISFDIPYNAHWGYAESPLSAFADHEATDDFPFGYVLFGSPTSGSLEGLANSCALTQSYELTLLPSRTAEVAKRTIEGRGSDIVPNATVRTINGLTVVQYTDVGLCSYPTMELVGKKYNYSFTTSCGGDTQEEWNVLEKVVESIKLTN